MSGFIGVYSATGDSDSYSAAGAVIELQVPADVTAHILRAWVGAAEGTDPVDEVQEVSLYVNDAAATVGTVITPVEFRGVRAPASACTVRGVAPTIGATPTDLYFDGYHVQNGFLYLPVPEERPIIVGNSTQDNFGIRFPVAPDQAMVISYGIIWGEIG